MVILYSKLEISIIQNWGDFYFIDNELTQLLLDPADAYIQRGRIVKLIIGQHNIWNWSV